MLVDGDFKTAYTIKMALEDQGFRVDTFTNPLYAFEVFKTNTFRYSVVITDPQTLDNQAFTLAQLILKVKPSANIILLRKPFTAAQIISDVKKLLKID